jgi:hypothetical protein
MQTPRPKPFNKQSSSAACLAPEGIAYQRIRKFRGQKKRTSAAKAGYGSVIYGTAEAVPFLKAEFSRRL